MRTKIAIGLGSSRRPKMVAQTLASLIDLKLPENCEVLLIFVDNAPEDPVEEVLNSIAANLPFRSCYFQEANPGIVHMRNRVLEEAINMGCDYLAYIDDDEIVSPIWLLEMYETAQKYQADVVSGRTLRRLPDDTPNWIKEGGFFEKGKRATGIERPTSSTCNVMFDVKKLGKTWQMRFDERLNFVGSSDILFFNQAHQKGAKIIWCNEAVVEEVIPESRATKEWLLQRAFRIGNTMSVRYKIQNSLITAYSKGILFAAGEWFTALAYKLRFIRDEHPEAHDTRRRHHLNIARGIWNGLFGKAVFEEYKQHHGH